MIKALSAIAATAAIALSTAAPVQAAERRGEGWIGQYFVNFVDREFSDTLHTTAPNGEYTRIEVQCAPGSDYYYYQWVGGNLTEAHVSWIAGEWCGV